MSSKLPAFYNDSSVNIWVEDSLTRDYLTAIWPRDNFHYIVAGGLAGVKAMVKHAAKEKLPVKVFAIVDRDLSKDNEDKWDDPLWTGVEYRARVLEVENFLLDTQAIAEAPGNAIGMGAQQIRERILNHATALKWWMTCKRVLSEINVMRNVGFPSDQMGYQVKNEDAAVAMLRECVWAKQTYPKIGNELQETVLRTRVQSAYQEVESWLNGDDWVEQFSGKELFNFIYGQVSSGPRVRIPATAEALAAEIGNIQFEKKRVHPSLNKLHESILRRSK